MYSYPRYPQRFKLPGSRPLQVPDADKVEPCSPKKIIEFAILLRPRSDGLSRLESWGIGSIGMGGGPGRGLNEEEMNDLHGARDEDLEALDAFAAEYGLEVLDQDAISRVVVLRGSASSIEEAFEIELHQYETDDCSYRSHEESISIPKELAGRVYGIFGLEDRSVVLPTAIQGLYSPQLQFPVQGPLPPNAPPTATAFFPPQVAELYDFPEETDGSGASIAILELGGGYDPEDMRVYFEEDLGMEMPNLVDVSVAGATNNPGEDQAADVEVSLDIQVAGAVAPGAEIAVYFAPPSSYGFLRALQAAVHGPRRHDVISISWSGPEMSQVPSIILAVHQVLREAAARGIPVCVAAGDRGSADSSPFFPPDGFAHVGFPASSPYAIACGGTSITAEDGEIVEEVVWKNEPDPEAGATEFAGATGGGVSRYFPIPPYQSWIGLFPPSANPGAGFGRGLPDVAGHADPTKGYIIRMQGELKVFGGTSAVAPLWAALIARLNQKLGVKLPALHPYIYALRGGAGFHDIVEGDNDTAPEAEGYPALPGWDACTGWGSPRGTALCDALHRFGFCPPDDENQRGRGRGQRRRRDR